MDVHGVEPSDSHPSPSLDGSPSTAETNVGSSDALARADDDVSEPFDDDPILGQVMQGDPVQDENDEDLDVPPQFTKIQFY